MKKMMKADTSSGGICEFLCENEEFPPCELFGYCIFCMDEQLDEVITALAKLAKFYRFDEFSDADHELLKRDMADNCKFKRRVAKIYLLAKELNDAVDNYNRFN